MATPEGDNRLFTIILGSLTIVFLIFGYAYLKNPSFGTVEQSGDLVLNDQDARLLILILGAIILSAGWSTLLGQKKEKR
jgi:hypothetical protein